MTRKTITQPDGAEAKSTLMMGQVRAAVFSGIMDYYGLDEADDYDQEEASGITAAVMEYLEPEVERLQAQLTAAQARATCTCGGWRRGEHRQTCREYVGPLQHAWIRTSWNETFGGLDHWCSCGGWFRQGGLAGHGDGTEGAEAICPKAEQDWRGTRSDGR